MLGSYTRVFTVLDMDYKLPYTLVNTVNAV